MEYEEDGIGSNLVELYVRLRNELGADFRGMDPIDSPRPYSNVDTTLCSSEPFDR